MKRILAPMVLALALGSPSLAQDLPPGDTSGKGAVLCMQEILIATKASVDVCGWERTPTDDVIEAGLVDIDTFILANASPPLTAEEVNALASAKLSKYVRSFQEKPNYCDGGFSSDSSFAWGFHTMDPNQLREGIADMLSVPRLPVMNPCL